MGEPSEEALAEAKKLYAKVARAEYWGDGSTDARDAIAAAWQRHIERAESAESRVKELEAELESTSRRHEETVRAVRLRAEAAEGKLADALHNNHFCLVRAEDADRSKAALIREVEEWGRDLDFATWPGLEAILDRHAEKKP